MPSWRGEQVGLLEHGAAFADRDDVVFGAVERHQLAEAPDAGEIEPALGAGALGAPAVLEEAEALGDGQPVPVVLDVEQAAALGAGDVHLVDAVGRAAGGVDALLEGSGWGGAHDGRNVQEDGVG